MADQGLKPARIRTGLMRKFYLGPHTLPQLKVVQRFLSETVGANDYLDGLRRMVRETAFTGQEQDFDAFSFTWRTEEDGRPYVGSGADENPFLVGVSSKKLLRQADRNPATFVVHMDATFKCNHVDYPVFVVGITDCCRKFHLMAIFVSSQRKEIHFSEALMALRKVYSQVTGKQLAVRFAMGGADDAQYNAVVRVLGADYEVEVLMCFYCVAAKVHEKTRKLHHSLYTVVTSGVHDLHFAAGELEYEEAKTRILNDWALHPGLESFKEYFKQQWLTHRFWRWQVFHTHPAFAVTNNPVETFNASLKPDYTLRVRIKMGSLLRQLMACCTHESTTSRSFAVDLAPSVTLVRGASAMRKAGMLLELQCRHNSIAFLLSNAQEGGSDSAIDVVRVFSRQVPRVFDPEAKRSRKALPVTAQLGEQTVRMEIEGMPEGGWPVNTLSWTGPCRYWMKFAACIHTLLAKHVCGVHAMGKRERLVYRGPHKRQGAYVGGLPGRPCFNAPALQIE